MFFSLLYDRHFISSSLFFVFFYLGSKDNYSVLISLLSPFPFLMKICVKNDQEKKGAFYIQTTLTLFGRFYFFR